MKVKVKKKIDESMPIWRTAVVPSIQTSGGRNCSIMLNPNTTTAAENYKARMELFNGNNA
jgi:hypothetical protein